MFEKLFAKYARAIHDERERARMYKLFLAQKIAAIAFYVVCVAVIAEAFVFSQMWAHGGYDGFVPFFVTLVLWICSAITALVLAIKFHSAYKRIINRPSFDGELPEIASYRKKIREGNSDAKKTMRVPTVILALGIIFMIVAVAVDAVKHPEEEDLTALGIAGIVVFGITLFVFAMWLSVARIKKSMNGGTVEMRAADDAKKIDAAQGRQHEYSLAEDDAMRSLVYLFPNPELRKEAERLSKLQVKATLISALVSVVVSGVIALVFFSPVVFGKNLLGYAFPTLIALMFVSVMLSILPVIVKSNKLEKRQRAEIDGNPAYEKTMHIYKLCDDFSKFKNKVIIVFFVAAIIVGFALAIVFPDTWLSLISTLVLLVGLLLNNKLLADLRKSVRVIEDEIATPTDVKFTVRTDEDERSLEVYQAIKTVREGDTLVAENGGGNFELYLENTELCLVCDTESKRVADLSGKFFVADMPTAHVDMPAEYDTGIMYFDFEGEPLGGTAMHISFDRACAYDAENKLLVLGTYSLEEKLYKVTANMYVQIADGKLGCILLSDI